MFWQGFITAVVCGAVGCLIAHVGLDVANLSVGAALIGGVAYMVGYVNGAADKEEKNAVGPRDIPPPDSGFTA